MTFRQTPRLLHILHNHKRSPLIRLQQPEPRISCEGRNLPGLTIQIPNYSALIHDVKHMAYSTGALSVNDGTRARTMGP